MKKVFRTLHLWLGLLSGLVVFIVSITGAIYCFQKEITDALEPWRFVEAQDLPYAAPSVLTDTASYYLPTAKPSGITYDGKEQAAGVGMMDKDGFHLILLNPYTAQFIRHNKPASQKFNFFRFIINGHRALWLPYKIGRPIVGASVLIFVLMLISGLVLWYPKQWNAKTRKASFKISWTAKFKRLNRDLHNVLGFYICAFALVFALTGLVISYDWFADGVYFATSGGKEKPAYVAAKSDTTNMMAHYAKPIDIAFAKSLKEQPNPSRVFLFPSVSTKEQAIAVYFYQGKGKLYNRNSYYYDQYTLEPIRLPGDRFDDAPFAEKLSLMNYDIHTGAVWGIWGKIIAFITSLIIASLPVTGYIIWWKKRRK